MLWFKNKSNKGRHIMKKLILSAAMTFLVMPQVTMAMESKPCYQLTPEQLQDVCNRVVCDKLKKRSTSPYCGKGPIGKQYRYCRCE